jgi:hypothetical protein
LSQLVSGDVPEDTLEVYGIDITALQARKGDVTLTVFSSDQVTVQVNTK